jgi:predicted HicB family RNase H-like nuclease
MSKFVIDKDEDKISSINRTIRMKPDLFDKITQLSEQSGVSFNKIVNQCIEYALDNMDEG